MSLVERLFSMQLVPATMVNPRTAVHMGLLEFIQKMKLSAQVSITAWVPVLNADMQENNEEVSIYDSRIKYVITKPLLILGYPFGN